MEEKNIRNEYIMLFLILSLAFALRIWGVWFGLPYIYHTDEHFEVMRALKLGMGVFDFDRIGKGFYFYLLFFEYGILFAILKAFSFVGNTDEFLLRYYFNDPTLIYLVGRITTVIIGTLNCWVLYLLGKRAYNARTGLFSALFLSVSYLHIISSHYITVDVPLTFLVTLTFLLMLKNNGEDKITCKNYILIGAIAASAVSTKLSGAVIVVPLIIFHFMNTYHKTIAGRVKDKKLWIGVLSFIGIYILTNPGIIFDFINVMHRTVNLFNPRGGDATTYKYVFTEKDQLYYLESVFDNFGYLLATFAILGTIMAIKNIRKSDYLFLSFLLPYIILILISKNRELIYPRYVLPIIPLLCIYGSNLFERILKNTKYHQLLIPLIGILLIIEPFIFSVQANINFTKPDARTIVKGWVESNIPEKSFILIVGSWILPSTRTAQLNLDPQMLDILISNNKADRKKYAKKRQEYLEIYKRSLNSKKTYNLVFVYNRKQLDYVKKRDKKIEYAILDKDFATYLNDERSTKKFPVIQDVRNVINVNEMKVIYSVKPGKHFRGPEIIVYKIM